MIPVIDLFAGPGGLGEGFSAFRVGKNNKFKIVLSIEKDKWARETLRLRSFFRQFVKGAPENYYEYLRGVLSLEELFLRYPVEAAAAESEAWLAELGSPEKFALSLIDERIKKALGGKSKWVLIGGPPCQAYSVVGRSRMAREPEKYRKDHRHLLYKEYLRIIAVHRPPVFVMENVKGILSSKVEGSLIINRILADLKHPCETNQRVTYKLFPFIDYGQRGSLPEESEVDPSRYILEAERHGIPQARHRLIILGLRSDLDAVPESLACSNDRVVISRVIGDLPRVRSSLSRGQDSSKAWVRAIDQLTDSNLPSEGIDVDVLRILRKAAKKLKGSLGRGAEFVPSGTVPRWQKGWFYDHKIGGTCNHSTRGHIAADLRRYFFAACFAKVRGKSPLLSDFPVNLLPKHENAKRTEEEGDVMFTDRFRVQVRNRPSTTITAHIAKDGHYFIHPDPIQCRSLTVREAARIQTFPDNYFFVGPRTEQYKQIGNAVPPLLARKLAGIVFHVLLKTD
jgi:DNA (cytosine-5)-methyltransferase 1